MEFVLKSRANVCLVKGCGHGASHSLPGGYVGNLLQFGQQGKVLCGGHHARLIEQINVSFCQFFVFTSCHDRLNSSTTLE